MPLNPPEPDRGFAVPRGPYPAPPDAGPRSAPPPQQPQPLPKTPQAPPERPGPPSEPFPAEPLPPPPPNAKPPQYLLKASSSGICTPFEQDARSGSRRDVSLASRAEAVTSSKMSDGSRFIDAESAREGAARQLASGSERALAMLQLNPASGAAMSPLPADFKFPDLRPVQQLECSERTLSTGLRTYIVEDRDAPVVQGVFLFPGGVYSSPAKQVW